MESDWLMFDLPYDGKSVMHYKFNNFGIGQPKKTTIESKATKHIIVTATSKAVTIERGSASQPKLFFPCSFGQPVAIRLAQAAEKKIGAEIRALFLLSVLY